MTVIPNCDVCEDTGWIEPECERHPTDAGPGCSCVVLPVPCEYCVMGRNRRNIRDARRVLDAARRVFG
jgi:hypothetical protein